MDERPIPNFKVGDFVRVINTGQIHRLAVAEFRSGEWWYRYEIDPMYSTLGLYWKESELIHANKDNNE